MIYCETTMRLPSASASVQERSAVRGVEEAALVACTMIVTAMSQGAAGVGGKDARGCTVTEGVDSDNDAW